MTENELFGNSEQLESSHFADPGKMVGDLISRRSAIDAIMCEPTDAHYPSWYAERLEQLPSAQQWIPCSERLPEEGEVVLTQAKFKDDMKMAVSSRIDYNYWTGWGTRDINIIAWMPLPEPAKIGSD